MSDKPTEPQAEDTAPKIPTFTERLDDWQRRRAEQSEQIEQDGETLRQLNEAAHIAGQNSRLYMPTAIRMPFVYVCAFVCGGVIGSSQASKMAGLRFRAEHAHMLPTTTTGWYMYHKSKNYVVARSAVKGFWKMGRKVSLWTVGFLGIEDLYDRSRQTKDALNTTMAALTIGGVFSLMSMCQSTFCCRRRNANTQVMFL